MVYFISKTNRNIINKFIYNSYIKINKDKGDR